VPVARPKRQAVSESTGSHSIVEARPLPPDRLINAASPQLRAFQARAPLLTPQQRLASAAVAAGLGVFSSQTMVDLYSAIYDSTDPGDLPDTDAWQIRQAFVGKDQDARIAAIRKVLGSGKDTLTREAARAAVARAATLITPDANPRHRTANAWRRRGEARAG
jgi:hypothetical protein